MYPLTNQALRENRPWHLSMQNKGRLTHTKEQYLWSQHTTEKSATLLLNWNWGTTVTRERLLELMLHGPRDVTYRRHGGQCRRGGNIPFTTVKPSLKTLATPPSSQEARHLVHSPCPTQKVRHVEHGPDCTTTHNPNDLGQVVGLDSVPGILSAPGRRCTHSQRALRPTVPSLRRGQDTHWGVPTTRRPTAPGSWRALTASEEPRKARGGQRHEPSPCEPDSPASTESCSEIVPRKARRSTCTICCCTTLVVSAVRRSSSSLKSSSMTLTRSSTTDKVSDSSSPSSLALVSKLWTPVSNLWGRRWRRSRRCSPWRSGAGYFPRSPGCRGRCRGRSAWGRRKGKGRGSAGGSKRRGRRESRTTTHVWHEDEMTDSRTTWANVVWHVIKTRNTKDN